MTVAEKTTTRRPVTIADCDRQITEWWQKFRTDSKANGDECLQKIDQWLDARLLIMAHGVAEPYEGES